MHSVVSSQNGLMSASTKNGSQLRLSCPRRHYKQTVAETSLSTQCKAKSSVYRSSKFDILRVGNVYTDVVIKTRSSTLSLQMNDA